MTANLRVREIECGRAISMAATGPLGAIGSAVLLLLTATAVAIGIVQSPLTASDLKEELLTPAELGGGWTMLFPIKEYNLKDTWASPSCYKWTTSFGGPAVNSTYTINTATLPQFSELIERTTAPPQSIFNMVVRCGNPRGRNPLLKKGGRLTTIPIEHIALFQGLGQASLGTLNYPEPDRHIIGVYGLIVRDSDIVTITYFGPGPLSKVRIWAEQAVAQIGGS